MDRGTLPAHRDRWVTEASPAAARLHRLTAEEHSLYQDLVTDRVGERLRLEQERVSWTWVMDRLPLVTSRRRRARLRRARAGNGFQWPRSRSA